MTKYHSQWFNWIKLCEMCSEYKIKSLYISIIWNEYEPTYFVFNLNVNRTNILEFLKEFVFFPILCVCDLTKLFKKQCYSILLCLLQDSVWMCRQMYKYLWWIWCAQNSISLIITSVYTIISFLQPFISSKLNSNYCNMQ